MSLSVTGVVKEIRESKSGSTGKGKDKKKWETQEFVIETEDEYNPLICFTVFNKNIKKVIGKITEGEEVKVKFNLNSKEHEGNYFHNVLAWKVKVIG